MLYIITALYEEAAPFLSALSLKKDLSFPHYELFQNDNVQLLITKSGAIPAAVGISSLLTCHPPGPEDFFLSVGTAACSDTSVAVGTPYLIQSIVNQASGRCFYPELLYRSPFAEAGLITSPIVLTEPPVRTCSPAPPSLISADLSSAVPVLYDMEGSAVFEAARTYLDCHQIALIKIVSDHMTELVSLSLAELRTRIRSCMEQHTAAILSWAEAVQSQLQTTAGFSSEEESFLLCAQAALQLSAASTCQLRQLMLYLHLSRPGYLSNLQQNLNLLLQSKKCTRKEGKQYLEQLRQIYL